MTNDHRNDEDRDGRTPAWGEAPQQRPADESRHGEHAAPTSTPQYGEHAPQQQYGEQAPRWGETDQDRSQVGHQHDQHGSQQQYAPAAAGAPTWQPHDAVKRKKKTIGVVAFILGLASLVLGVVGGWIVGKAIGNSGFADSVVQSGGTTTFDQQDAARQITNDPAVMGQVAGGAVVIGIAAILGLWALVQGIIAAVVARGRVWGILAIVLAAVATIATFVAYSVAAVAAVSGSGS